MEKHRNAAILDGVEIKYEVVRINPVAAEQLAQMVVPECLRKPVIMGPFVAVDIDDTPLTRPPEQ